MHRCGPTTTHAALFATRSGRVVTWIASFPAIVVRCMSRGESAG